MHEPGVVVSGLAPRLLLPSGQKKTSRSIERAHIGPVSFAEKRATGFRGQRSRPRIAAGGGPAVRTPPFSYSSVSRVSGRCSLFGFNRTSSWTVASPLRADWHTQDTSNPETV